MSWTPVSIDKNKNIVFQFQTKEPDGVILYMANQENVCISKFYNNNFQCMVIISL